VEEPLPPLCGRFWNETAHYWQPWVKQCDIPPLYQQEVIRSALALKLHCHEDTRAIIAAMTTSIPESAGRAGAPGTTGIAGLRDAYYVLNAFGLLGQFEEREQLAPLLALCCWSLSRDATAALGVESIINYELTLQDRVVVQAEGTESVCDPAEPFAGGMGILRVGVGRANDFGQELERWVSQTILLQDRKRHLHRGALTRSSEHRKQCRR
jgi:hypothetical protein